MTKFYPFHNFLRVSYFQLANQATRTVRCRPVRHFTRTRLPFKSRDLNGQWKKTYRHQKVDTEMLKTKKSKKWQNEGEKKCESRVEGGGGGAYSCLLWGGSTPTALSVESVACAFQFLVIMIIYLLLPLALCEGRNDNIHLI